MNNPLSTKKNSSNELTSALLHYFKSFLLPLFLAIFPSIFHYSNNASILNLASLVRMVIVNSLLALVVYILLLIITRGKPVKAANAACVLLIFFNAYGVAYSYLFRHDIIRVEHYTLLPLFVLLAIYISWFSAKLNSNFSSQLWTITTLVLGMLIVFNITKIVPVELEKKEKVAQAVTTEIASTTPSLGTLPDIYYFIFDEFSGFEPMRQYWHNQEVDKLKSFLESKDFIVAEESHGSSIDTIHQMATRLNYKEYPFESGGQKTWFADIADNQVMRYVKSKGYTTVVFDETKASFAYPAAASIKADYSYEVNQGSTTDMGLLFDEFGVMVADNTMLRPFSSYYKIDNPVYIQHRNMVLFTVAKVTDLREVSSPKFVYVHLMLPHMPFMFDSNGNMVDPQFYQNWNYYQGNYNYTIKLIEKMVTGILANEDPNRPPIIVLQSDHGARNKKTGSPDSIALQNFPEEYKTSIMYAMRFPGYNTSQMKQNINPVNTFPIIFNELFDANIPLK